MRWRALVLPLVKSVSATPAASEYSAANASTAGPTLSVIDSSAATNSSAATASASSCWTRYGNRTPTNTASPPRSRTRSTASCASLPARVESTPPDRPNTSPEAPLAPR